jgi:hypothetical protein
MEQVSPVLPPRHAPHSPLSLIQFSLVCALEILLRVLTMFEFGETAGPVIMFIIPVVFYLFLWWFGISFQEVFPPTAPPAHNLLMT